MLKKLSENETARRLWAEAVQSKGGHIDLIRITGAAPTLVQETILGLTVDQALLQLEQWTEERRAEFARQAEALFKQISTASFLGPAVAAQIFRAAIAKRRRGTEYGAKLNRAFLLHALIFGQTKTARRASELGLDVDEATLVKHIGRLLKKADAPSRRKARNPRTDK
jgi:hypothetical protein